jgi:ATP-dependent RNA helicase DeaD
MERFRVEVGETHGVKAENLVGAIANEAGLDAEFIGRIQIEGDHSFVELPSGMPKFLLKDLKRVWVCNRKLDMSRVSDNEAISADTGRGQGSNQGSDQRKNQPTSQKTGKKRSGPAEPKTLKRSGKGTARKTEHKIRAEGDQTDQQKAGVKGEARKKDRHRDRKNKGKPG